MIAATTRLVALLGHPVAHSVSPAMHNAAFAHAGLDLAYVAADVEPGDLPRAIDGLAALGAVGANVTVPHKRAALAACATVTDRARAVGAVNTICFTTTGPTGDNTDVAGFLAGLADGGPGRAVVLGAGGAARAVVVGLLDRGAAATVVARDVDRAGGLAGLVEGDSAGSVDVIGVDDERVAAAVEDADLVVNATPLGWHGEPLPAPFHRLGEGQVAYDLNYAVASSPFLADAARNGAGAVDGMAMVVGQAAASFRRWTGVDPDVEVLRAAAEGSRDSGREVDESSPGSPRT